MEHPLKRYRLKHGLTLDDIAEQVGTSPATISRVENRKQAASWGLVAKLKEITKGIVTPDDFLPEGR
jgi:transcriptional regulator with XRE-family HTH domain